jgi:isoquinoline 1-oxidoreductase subunit beta
MPRSSASSAARSAGSTAPRIVKGEPIFGVDTQLPGMVYAAFERAPVFGAKLVSADVEAAKAAAGVDRCLHRQGRRQCRRLVDGVAIIASNWWYANKAREAQRPVGQRRMGRPFDRRLRCRPAPLAGGQPQEVFAKKGDVDAALRLGRQGDRGRVLPIPSSPTWRWSR